MIENQFKISIIPENTSRELGKLGAGCGPDYVISLLSDTVFYGTSKLLSAMKSTSQAKAIKFVKNGRFIIGTKIEYIPNKDNPNDVSAGRWDYIWTFYEDDLDNTQNIIFSQDMNPSLIHYYAEAADKMHGLDSNDLMMKSKMFIDATLILLNEIKEWLKCHASDQGIKLVHDGLFYATARKTDGEIELGLVPSSELKVLIKNDSAIQEY